MQRRKTIDLMQVVIFDNDMDEELLLIQSARRSNSGGC